MLNKVKVEFNILREKYESEKKIDKESIRNLEFLKSEM